MSEPEIPLHAYPEGESPTAPPEDRPATTFTGRVYLLNPAMGFEPLVGPVDEGVQPGDTVLCYHAPTKEQWTCRVKEVRPNLLALVERT